MTTATRPTAAQLDHLRAAAAGELWCNGTGQFRRFVRTDGGRVSGAVCERLCGELGLARCEAQERAASLFQVVPTPAAIDFLATV
jgi:hypothetical protein